VTPGLRHRTPAVQLPRASGACQRCRRRRSRASLCGRVGAYAARPHERHPCRPCHYRAIHNGRERSHADTHGQSHGRMTCAVRHLARWQPRPNWLRKLVVGWSRLASALPCPADRSGPWSRRTGARRRPRPDGTGPLGPRWVRGAPGPQGHGWSPAVTSGHQRRSGTAGRPAFKSGSSRKASSRIRLWSRRSGFESPRSPAAVLGARQLDAAEVAVRVAESSRAQPAPWTRPAVASGHVAGSGPSTLMTVAPTPPTRTSAPAPPSAATVSRWIRRAGM
jgi:hypothetical protein